MTAWDTLPDSVEADAGFAWFEGEEEATGRTYMLSASLMGEGETVSELSVSVE